MFDLIKSLFLKQPMKVENLDLGYCIGLNTILRYDPQSLPVLRKLQPLLFYVDPKHYLILLFLLLSKREKAPYLKGVKKLEKEEDNLYAKIRYVLGWSERELNLHKKLLHKIIDRTYWINELAVKGAK